MTAEKCSWHKPGDLSYMNFFYDAEKREAKGEKQIQCTVCKYWFWPHEFGIINFFKMGKQITTLGMNIAIADFMEWIHSDNKDMDELEMSELKYHSSWDKLRPVIDKINGLKWSDMKGVQERTFMLHTMNIVQLPITTPIDVAHNFVFGFVRWYRQVMTRKEYKKSVEKLES